MHIIQSSVATYCEFHNKTCLLLQAWQAHMQTFLKVQVTLQSPFIVLINWIDELTSQAFFPFSNLCLWKTIDHSYFLNIFFPNLHYWKNHFFPKPFVSVVQKLAPKKKLIVTNFFFFQIYCFQRLVRFPISWFVFFLKL